jgi:lipid-A-disaccharide synthase
MSDPRPTLLMVAGEASGDLHGSKVLARLRERAPDLSVYGIGGDRMRDRGLETLYHADDLAVVGLVEVLRHVPRLKSALDGTVRAVRARGTRVAILIDYPGFNLVLARRLAALGVRVLYYISPQVWAWGEGRVRTIARVVDRLAVAFPFEVDFYRERGVDAEFVGHPLLEEPWVAEVKGPKTTLGDPPVLGLLPGSRRQEIARHLEPMVGAAEILRRSIPGLRVRLGLAHGFGPGILDAFGTAGSGLIEPVASENVPDVLTTSTALLVASGTATLEAACAGTPMVVLYRVAPLTYLVGKLALRVPDIGLVNLVAGTRVVPEVVQGEVTPSRLAREVMPYLTDLDRVRDVSRRLLAVRAKLGEPGASDRVATAALSMLSEAGPGSSRGVPVDGPR